MVLLDYPQIGERLRHFSSTDVIKERDHPLSVTRFESPIERDVDGLPPSTSEDKELALAFKRGEKGAYQAIYERHSARVQGVCRRMLLSPDDAAEASQETFLKVYQALNRFNGRYQLGAWITRIATNVCLDHLRATARRPTTWASVEELDEKELPRRLALEEEPETFFIKKTEGRRVYKVLQSLPPMHRAAIVLRDFEGLPYCEIALALDITESQVKALLHRARGGFKKSWATSGLAAFLPWNLLDRFRRPESALVDQAHAAASSASHIVQAAGPTANLAATCSMALQQCGQAFTERFATAVTALIVGTAAISSGVAASSPAEPVVETAPDDSHERAARAFVRSTGATKEDIKKKSVTSVPVAPSEPAPDEPAPAEEPEPVETPIVSGSGDEDGEGGVSEQEPNPTYPPVAPAVGWERGVPISPTAPTSNGMKLDCATKVFTQQLETTIQDGDTSYPAAVNIDIDTTATLNLTVWKYDQEITYNGGAPQLVASGPGRDTVWSMGGSYSADGGRDPRGVGLPVYGRFTLRLSLDCVASVVKAEYLGLTAD